MTTTEKQITAIVIGADESIAVHTFAGLTDYQRAVGGYIETVTLNGNHDMIVNEEGRLQRLPFNRIASAIAVRHGIAGLLVGPAIIVGHARGEFTNADPAFLAEHDDLLKLAEHDCIG